MGLDMFLSTQVYVSGYSHSPEDETAKYRAVLDALGFDADVVPDHTPSVTVNVSAAYWRKANAIHNWFVKNVQDGVDDCKSYYVDREQLVKLADTAQAILDTVEYGDPIVHAPDPNGFWKMVQEGYEEKTLKSVDTQLVADTLPPSAGFFFGSTDVDVYYVQDLTDTVEQITRVLNEPSFMHADFEYRASW